MAKTPTSSTSPDATQLSEALRLSLIEGLSIRAISRRLLITRKKVRRLLGRAPVRSPALKEPRGSLLDTYDAAIRKLVDDTPELTAPGVLERLRPLGYTGGISILRDRLRGLPSLPT